MSAFMNTLGAFHSRFRHVWFPVDVHRDDLTSGGFRSVAVAGPGGTKIVVVGKGNRRA